MQNCTHCLGFVYHIPNQYIIRTCGKHGQHKGLLGRTADAGQVTVHTMTRITCLCPVDTLSGESVAGVIMERPVRGTSERLSSYIKTESLETKRFD